MSDRIGDRIGIRAKCFDCGHIFYEELTFDRRFESEDWVMRRNHREFMIGNIRWICPQCKGDARAIDSDQNVTHFNLQSHAEDERKDQ